MTDTRYKVFSNILYLKEEDLDEVKLMLSNSTKFKIQCDKYAAKSERDKKLMFCGRYYCGEDDHYHFLLSNDERRRLYRLINTPL